MFRFYHALIFTLAMGIILMSGHGYAIAQVVATAPLDDKVVIPWGNAVGQIALLIGSCAASMVALAFRVLPAQWAAAGKTARVDQLLERAIQYGANVVEGGTRDKEISVEVANDMIEAAAEYAIKHGADTVIQWAGGASGIRDKIIARLDNIAPAAAVSP